MNRSAEEWITFCEGISVQLIKQFFSLRNTLFRVFLYHGNIYVVMSSSKFRIAPVGHLLLSFRLKFHV